jgi:hypothetical protein
MPLGEAGAASILKAVKASFFAYIGFELIAFLYPYISDKNKALKWHIYATLSSMVFFVAFTIISTVVLGENFLCVLSMPFYDISRIYNAPILERVDLYIIGLWFIPMACSIRNYVFTAYDGLQKVFKLPKTKFAYFLYVVFILIFSSIPEDINQVLELIDIINMSGMGVSFFLILCLILSFVRKKGVRVK